MMIPFKAQIDILIENVETVWLNNTPEIKQVVQNLEFIISCISKNEIKCGLPDEAGASGNCIDDSDFVRPSLATKKRGRSQTVKSIDQRLPKSDTSSSSLNDSASSTSSNRPRRAAAQAADEKLVQVQNLMKATKLRRPSDFDEKHNKQLDASVSLAKCRRTDQKKSTGNFSQDENIGMQVDNDEVLQKENACKKECDVYENHTIKTCTVHLEPLEIQSNQSYLKHKSRSLERIPAKRKSDELLFVDSPPVKKLVRKTNIDTITIGNNNENIGNIKRSLVLENAEHLHVGISTNDEKINQLKNEESFLTQMSTIPRGSLETNEDFLGFDFQQTLKVRKSQSLENLPKETCNANLELIETQEETHQVIRKTFDKNEIEIHTIKSRTKVLRKRDDKADSEICSNIEEKENVIASDSPSGRSRTKVVRKTEDSTDKNANVEVTGILNNSKIKTCLPIESDSDLSPENKGRSRTKTLRKNEERTLRKTLTLPEDKVLENKSQYPGTESTEISVAVNLQSKNILEMAKSPAPVKGELVRKRVENFEKMKNTFEVVEADTGRVTRNAARNKAISTSSEPLSMKRNPDKGRVADSSNKKYLQGRLIKTNQDNRACNKENIIPSSNKVMSVKKNNLTPSNHYRGIPGTNSARVVNKGLMSATRQFPEEDHSPPTGVVEKQINVEVEKKKKVEERMRRQVKEEEAKKKKEKKLEAKSEEARRKREGKLQKAAAAREAAEKGKAQLAAKQEKEREEKFKLIAIEKEKQKEEQQKRKHLAQQKAIELEERRKQDDAARLAKLKEQEEEHRRALAIKEREQDIMKQQKAEQLRLAEAEKAKQHGGKLAKVAVANNAKMKLQSGTPLQPSNETYEITPAREDRPLKEPKTENDYGIDDATCDDSSEDESQPKKIIPKWAQAKNRSCLLKVNHHITKEYWGQFMACNPKPDLDKMFEGHIPIKRRVRTSSAVWRTPPRMF